MPDGPWYHRVAGIREYDESLKAWIQRYRKGWERDDLEFLLVMLPGYGAALPSGPVKNSTHPASHSWAWLRESQMAALELPHTAVANTIDLGDVKNIHPRDKGPIGERLALLAAQRVLKKELVADGPTFQKVERQAGKLLVKFDCAAGLKTNDGKAPREFWISDEKGTEWLPAVAALEGNGITLSNPKLKAPHHVRYAFTGKPSVNLVNGAGLPAYPFRSDDFAP